MEPFTVVAAVATACSSIATVWYAVLTSSLNKTALRQAELAREQADAATQALELSRQPHLLLSPHPMAEPGGNSTGFIVNFGALPVDLQGGWIEKINRREVQSRIIIKQYHTQDKATYLRTMERAEIEFVDHQLSPGWYVLRVMFGYPTFPNRTLYFDLLVHKRDHNPPLYRLRDVAYILDCAGGEPPATTLQPNEPPIPSLASNRLEDLRPGRSGR